jgi:hypothetical protein
MTNLQINMAIAEGRFIADFSNDLKAMREVVLLSRCNGDLSDLYIKNLCKACGVEHNYLCIALIHATARQIAEAFLRTIEKWKDEE